MHYHANKQRIVQIITGFTISLFYFFFLSLSYYFCWRINYGSDIVKKYFSNGGTRGGWEYGEDRKHHSHVYRVEVSEGTEQRIQCVHISCGNIGKNLNESLKVWLFCT